MAQSGRKRHRQSKFLADQTGQDVVATPSRPSKLVTRSLWAGLVVVAGVLAMFSIKPDWFIGHVAPVMPAESTALDPIVNGPVAPVQFHTDFGLEPKTLNELLDIPNSDLGEVDIARMNLLCASGLPSTRGLDVEHALSTLDQWAKRVAFETDRHLYRVTDPRYAGRYGGSEAQFRAEMLAQVLQEDLGVKYDLTTVDDFSFADPAVAFIHGMIPARGQTTADTPGGTCVSMPVLYVAVGRRLGYPLKLSTADSHIFARWDGGHHPNPGFRGRFNCETTHGFHCFDDNYYRTWPKPVTEQQIAVNGFLEALTPAEELAQFLAARGHHAMDVDQFGFAARCYENAYRYDSQRPCYRSWFSIAAMRSDYRPATPALAQWIDQHRQRAAGNGNSPLSAGVPNPNQTRAFAGLHMPPTAQVAG